MLTIRLNAQSCTIVRHRSSGVEILASCDVSDVVDAAQSMEDANDELGIDPLPPDALRRLLVDGLAIVCIAAWETRYIDDDAREPMLGMINNE